MDLSVYINEIWQGLKPIINEALRLLIMGIAAAVLLKAQQLLGVKVKQERFATARQIGSTIVRAVEQCPELTQPQKKKEAAVEALKPHLPKKLKPLANEIVEASVKDLKEDKQIVEVRRKQP